MVGGGISGVGADGGSIYRVVVVSMLVVVFVLWLF